MPDDRLPYLQDHLAGSRFALELLKDLKQQEIAPDIAALAAKLFEEITADRQVLENLVEALGGDPSTPKDVASWIAQKVARFKLDVGTRLGIFEAIEFLCLGIQGKLALWTALESSARHPDLELKRLQSRAIEQHAALESMRLSWAASLFAGWDLQVECRRMEEGLQDWAKTHGIEMGKKAFAAGKAGEFDGVTLVMNSTYCPEERLYYALHAIGSIVIWSDNRDGVQELFDELRDAKKEESASSKRLCEAIERYRAFELESSEYAVWILCQLGAESLVPSYSNFMRADVEAMTEFHQTGKAPVWKEFFRRWNAQIAAGERKVEAFGPKEANQFRAIQIEKQQILQQQ